MPQTAGIYPLEIPESGVQVSQEALKGLNLLCVHTRDFLGVCLCLYSSVYDGTVTGVRAHLRNAPSAKDPILHASWWQTELGIERPI